VASSTLTKEEVEVWIRNKTEQSGINVILEQLDKEM